MATSTLDDKRREAVAVARIRTVLSVVALLALAGCTPLADANSAGESGGATKQLPNLVGMGLQYAQDTAQGAGFYNLASHDALGRGRHQILDRDWKVCSQTPQPGLVGTRTKVTLAAVKVNETCPARDEGQQPPQRAGSVMPNLVGKSVQVALNTLGGNASIRWVDATGKGRAVLVPSNWQVCTQQPAPGAAFGGVPVNLTVVKFTEHC